MPLRTGCFSPQTLLVITRFLNQVVAEPLPLDEQSSIRDLDRRLRHAGTIFLWEYV